MKAKEQQMNDIKLMKDVSNPAQSFIFFRFKDTLKVEDFGGILDATYRLPQCQEYHSAQNNKKIFIFGDDSYNRTILMYDLFKDEWQMKKLKENMAEKFLNCSASIALSNDLVMITGGGSPP